MQKLFFIFSLTTLLLSCNKTDSLELETNQIVNGTFVEKTPEENRTTLIISNNNLLKEVPSNKNFKTNTYTIRLLENNKIEMSSNEADEVSPKILHYKALDKNHFEIGNFLNDDSYFGLLVFKRK